MFYNSKFYLIHTTTGVITGKMLSNTSDTLKLTQAAVVKLKDDAYTGTASDFEEVTLMEQNRPVIVPMSSVGFAVEIGALPKANRSAPKASSAPKTSSTAKKNSTTKKSSSKAATSAPAAKPMTMD